MKKENEQLSKEVILLDEKKNSHQVAFLPPIEANNKPQEGLMGLLKNTGDLVIQGYRDEKLFDALKQGTFSEVGFIAHSAITGLIQTSQKTVEGNLFMQAKILNILELVAVSHDQFKNNVLEVNKRNHELVQKLHETMDLKMKEALLEMNKLIVIWENKNIPQEAKLEVYKGQKELMQKYLETVPLCFNSLIKMAGENILDNTFLQECTKASSQVMNRMLESVDKIAELNVSAVQQLGKTLVNWAKSKLESTVEPKAIKNDDKSAKEKYEKAIQQAKGLWNALKKDFDEKKEESSVKRPELMKWQEELKKYIKESENDNFESLEMLEKLVSTLEEKKENLQAGTELLNNF